MEHYALEYIWNGRRSELTNAIGKIIIQKEKCKSF